MLILPSSPEEVLEGKLLSPGAHLRFQGVPFLQREEATVGGGAESTSGSNALVGTECELRKRQEVEGSCLALFERIELVPRVVDFFLTVLFILGIFDKF